MQIIVKCWTPEWYDFVTHAVIKFDLALIHDLLNKLQYAELISKGYGSKQRFIGLEFNSSDPLFIDLGDPTEIGLEDDDSLDDEGYAIIPAKFQNHEWDEVAMFPVAQIIRAANGSKSGGTVYWQAYDKHSGADGRIETYSLSAEDLREIKEQLVCSTK